MVSSQRLPMGNLKEEICLFTPYKIRIIKLKFILEKQVILIIDYMLIKVYQNIVIKLYKWIKNLGWDNIKCEVLKECDIVDVDKWEIYFIEKYDGLGYTLYNEQHTHSYDAIDIINKYQFK